MTWHKRHKESLTLGQRAADKIRNGMGSWTFVFGFLVIMAAWMGLNIAGLIHPFDPYPFILLNLALSTLAGLQGAILLIADRRGDEISAALAQSDYETDLATKQQLERVEKRQIEILTAIEEIKLQVEARDL